MLTHALLLILAAANTAVTGASPRSTTDILTNIGLFISGGGLVALAEVLRKFYTSKLKNSEHADELAAEREARESDNSRSFARDANEERRATLAKVEAQSAEITRLSVEIAQCKAQHEIAAIRDSEKDARINQMNFALDAMKQLVDKQREEIAAQEVVIEKQGVDIVELHHEMATLKSAFDALVKRAMNVERLSDIPGGQTP